MSETDGAGLFVIVFVCVMFALYAAQQTDRGQLEAILHGLLLGPFGPILIALYPRRNQTEAAAQPAIDDRRRDDEIVQLLQRIRAELQWQRQQTKPGDSLADDALRRMRQAKVNSPADQDLLDR